MTWVLRGGLLQRSEVTLPCGRRLILQAMLLKRRMLKTLWSGYGDDEALTVSRILRMMLTCDREDRLMTVYRNLGASEELVMQIVS